MPPAATPADQIVLWGARLRVMACAWNQAAARRRRVLLARWGESMTEMCRQHDRLVADRLWLAGPSAFLDVVGLARDENTHSRMLAWLLQPTARHGLGCGFVRRLVVHCAREAVPAAIAVRKVSFSEWRNGREADLVIRGREFTLVIESKIDAREQPAQCDDLYENFKGEVAPLFLFLTPDGRKPSTATTLESQRAFKTLSWADIRVMLEDALRESGRVAQVASGVDVVRNYLRTLKEQFG